MNRINYSLECDKLLEEAVKSGKNKLLLHVCCAPCSSSVIEYLEEKMDITLYFYNPNISDREEFFYRLSELQRFVEERPGKKFPIMTPQYDPNEFFAMAKGLEELPEGGARCFDCYDMRLRRTAQAAVEGKYDFFTTTLSVSPYKNAEKLNTVGCAIGEEYGVRYLTSDFKKKNGYLRSIELSSVYNLYRQDFCGCVFSQAEAEKRRAQRQN